MLSDISDNQARRMLLLSDDGELLESLDAKGVRDYIVIKERKDKYLRNRKKKVKKKNES
jgi:hypothetical protein